MHGFHRPFGKARSISMANPAFRNDIQGLRAVAVVAVVLNHAFPQFLTGGFVGVDIFFVISGYLIPQIIVRNIDAGKFSLADFYRRRARRILPALFVVVAAVLACGWLILPPSAYHELALTSISTSLFVSNFHFSRLTGYFDGAAELKPLLHMWSLAVEEQYYILFPPMLYLAWRHLGPRKARGLLWAAGFGALCVSEVGRQLSHTASYYLLPTRAVELMVGTLFGIGGLPILTNARARDALSLAGVAMMLAAIVFYTPTTPFPGLPVLLPCVGAGLVIYAGTGGQTIGGRLLSFQPALYLGAISYSLYLWHWPVLAFLRNLTSAELPAAGAIGAVAVTLALASLSYHFVERPFLSDRARKLPYLRLAAVSTAAVLATSAAIVRNEGVPSRFSRPAQQLFAANQDFNYRRDDCQNAAEAWLPYAKSCIFGTATTKPDLAVWGDSHGGELALYLGERAAQHGRSVRQLTSSACPPAMQIDVSYRPNCRAINRQTLAALTRDPAIRMVVLIANGSMYQDRAGLERGLRSSIEALLAAGKQVILVKQIPTMPYDIAQRAGLFRQIGSPLGVLGMRRSDAFAQSLGYDAFLDGLGRQYGLVEYDPKAALCASEFCHGVLHDSVVLYFNSQHLSVAGIRIVFKSLADELYAQESAIRSTMKGGSSRDRAGSGAAEAVMPRETPPPLPAAGSL